MFCSSGFPMFLHQNGCICPKPEQSREGDVSVSVVGGPVFYSQEGQSVSMECQVRGLTSPPEALQWRMDSHVISPRTRPGSSLETVRQSPSSQSTLYIAEAELSDTGNYTCSCDGHTQTVLLVVTALGQTPDICHYYSSISIRDQFHTDFYLESGHLEVKYIE